MASLFQAPSKKDSDFGDTLPKGPPIKGEDIAHCVEWNQNSDTLTCKVMVLSVTGQFPKLGRPEPGMLIKELNLNYHIMDIH